ncbi:MAG TPA: DUF1638 domain-containing protein [Acidimicrobiales bacterium]|nr:DUF1638 domain-containing protein [Acidimicrobiales bacterium]
MSVIACGALASRVRAIAARRNWPVEVHALPPLLHNHPDRIAQAVEDLARTLTTDGATVAVAYADCGTYGALDRVCETRGLRRLPGLTCYDVLAGADEVAKLFTEQPGTYLLTDFLVKSFRRTVWAELGLDRHPELRDDYFANYRRVVWLAGQRTEGLERSATEVARMLGLPLSIIDVGDKNLERELETLLKAQVER